jgi:hypothetical protein
MGALGGEREEQASEEADNHPLSPTRKGNYEPHEQGRCSDHQADRDEHPTHISVVAEVPGSDPPHELEGRQVDAAQNHVNATMVGNRRNPGL